MTNETSQQYGADVTTEIVNHIISTIDRMGILGRDVGIIMNPQMRPDDAANRIYTISRQTGGIRLATVLKLATATHLASRRRILAPNPSIITAGKAANRIGVAPVLLADTSAVSDQCSVAVDWYMNAISLTAAGLMVATFGDMDLPSMARRCGVGEKTTGAIIGHDMNTFANVRYREIFTIVRNCGSGFHLW